MEKFKSDLHLLTPVEVFRKHIVLRNSAILDDGIHFELRNRISEHFKINFNDIVVVGSAKLGFSIKPERRWQPFNDESDIDVAIVSAPLFRDFWMKLHRYKASGAYWPGFRKFKGYFFQGWIRPDLLPPDYNFAERRELWDFFNSLGRSGRYGSAKVKGGLYCDWEFLETYQSICINECKLDTAITT